MTKELKKGKAKGDSAERTVTFHKFDIYGYVDLDDGSVLSNKDKFKAVLTPTVAETPSTSLTDVPSTSVS